MRVISAFVEIEIGIIVIFEGGNRWNFFVFKFTRKCIKKKEGGTKGISEKIFHLYYSVFLDTFYFYLFKKS